VYLANKIKMTKINWKILLAYVFLNSLAMFVDSKSIIMANYHNVVLFFPREYGGNDDIRVIFDVRNVTIGTFRYMPVIVDVAYDSLLNIAYCYMESAITSYIMLLRWSGGQWCYQVLYDFPASQFSKYMYHSVILMDNFIYWTTERFVMSGRLPGYEKRLLLQPSWNRLYSMTADRTNKLLYVAAFDYTQNALFRCNLRIFSCVKILTTDFTLNFIRFNQFTNMLYVASMQAKYLYRYAEDYNTLIPISTVDREVSNIIFLEEDFAVYTNQQNIYVSKNINFPNSTRKAQPRLIDPYALQYVFTFNQVSNFDSYPYPYYFTDYHDLLYQNSLYLFYFYICSMDYVENDNVFLTQMDLNNRFIRLENCQTRFRQEQYQYLIPSIIAASIALILIIVIVMICLWRSKMCVTRTSQMKFKFKKCMINYSLCSLTGKKNPKAIKQEKKAKFDEEKLKKLSADELKKIQINTSDVLSSATMGGRPPTSTGLPYSNDSYQLKKTFSLTDNSLLSNELYDNDPANLNSPNKKNKSKTYSSGIYIIRKNNNQEINTPYVMSGSTPTISQNSSITNSSSINNNLHLTLSSPTSSSSFSTNVKEQNNKVKFNDYKIKHYYDQYDNYYPPHSKIYDQNYPIKIVATEEYLRGSPNYRISLNDSQLTEPFTIENTSVQRSKSQSHPRDKLNTTTGTEELSYVTNNKKKYFNIVKAVDSNIKVTSANM
jgi:hypothetical protein